MTIWVDADACPVAAKEILFRAALRSETPLVLVANQYIRVPPSPFIKSVQVVAGFDMADNEIAQKAEAGDLVVTADIPLAADVVAKKCVALNPRGELYTAENIRQRLNMRDFMETLRSSGIQSGGSPPYDQTDRQRFANQLDAYITRFKKSRG